MRKRLFRNLLQVIVALLLCLPQMALPTPVAASGDTNIEVEKAVVGGSTTVAAGTTVRFRISVRNTAANGDGTTGDAEDVVVYDIMPEGFVLVPGPDSPSLPFTYVEEAPGRYRFELGTILGGNTLVTFEYNAAIAADLVADKGGAYTFDNTVTAIVRSPLANDTDEMDNTYNLNLTVLENAQHLRVVKSDAHEGTPAVAGGPNEYYIGVVNEGPSAARDVKLTDVLSPDEIFDSVEFLEGDGTCAYIASTHSLDCRLGTVMPSNLIEDTGEYEPTVALVVHTMVKSSVAEGATITNQAAISWPVFVGGITNGEEILTDDVEWSNTVDRQVSLTVDKQSSPNPVTVGNSLFYKIAVTNEGPSDANNIVLTDDLPDGVTFVAAADNGDWVQTAGDTVFTLNRPLAAGETIGLTLEVKTDTGLYADLLSTETLITNNVCAISSEMAADEQDPACTAEDTYLDEEADLAVFKVGSPEGQVLAGEDLEYTIEVYNLGASDARDVVITDDVVSLEGITVVGGAFDEAPASGVTGPTPVDDDTLQATIALLPAGERAVLRITVSSDEAVDVTNLVHVAAGTPDPDMSNNDASVFTEIVALADLSVTKVAPVPNSTAGMPTQFEITVVNNGPSTAENVVVKDYIPAGVELMDVETSVGSWMGGTAGNPFDPILVALGSLAPEASVSITVTVQVDPDYTGYTSPDFIGWLINDVEVSSDTLDPDNGNNVDQAYSIVRALADVEVIKGESPDPATAGTVMEWPLVVTNYGPSVARNVQLVDALPMGTEFITMDMVSGEAQCQYSWTMRLVTCEFGDMAPGETVTMLLRTSVNPDVEDGAVIENSAYVASRILFDAPDHPIGYPMTPDPNTDNNISIDSGTVYRQSWLSVTKTASPDPVLAGDKLYYTVTVCNKGPSVASGISITDYLPPFVDYIGFTGPAWWLESFTPPSESAPATAVWTTDMVLYPDQCSTFTIEVLVRSDTAAWDWPSMSPDQRVVDPYGSEVIRNDVCASWSEAPVEEEQGPIQSCTSTESFVDEEADLYIVKTGMPDGQVLAGDTLRYTVYVYNLGISDARNVVVTDNILAIEGVEITNLQPIEGMDAAYALSDGMQIEALKDVLPAGQRVGYVVEVTWPEGVDVANLVHVASDTPDPDMSNNDDETIHEIIPVADLQVLKVPTTGQAIAGTDVSFRLTVVNGGPSTAENVVVSEYLPAHTTLVGAVPSAGSYSAGTPGDSGDPLLWTVGDLAPTSSATLDLTLHLDYDYPMDPTLADPAQGTLWNSSSVTSDVLDPWMGNNTTAVNMAVMALPNLVVEKDAAPADVVVAGEPLDYTLTVRNAGVSTARDVVLTDYLPTWALDFVDAQAAVGEASCTFSAEYSQLVCDLGDLDPDEQVVVLVRTVTHADLYPEASIINSVIVETSLHESEYEDNFAWTSHDVTRVANVTVTKESWPEPVIAGDKLYYGITVTNEGPSQATQIGISDTWDGNLQLLNWTGPDWHQTAEGEWFLNVALMPGESNTIVLEFMVNPAAANETGSYVLDDQVCAQWAETPGSACGLEEQTFVDEEADLYIVKTGMPDGEVLAGEPLEYTIWVYNLGLSDARNVLVRDNILSIEGVSLDDLRVIQGPAEVHPSPDGMYIEATAGVLPAGTRMGYKVVVTWPEGVDVANLVHVQSDTPDPDLSNNDAETMHEIVPVADLNVAKSIVSVGYAGESITYRIEVSNSGPSTAENVVVKDAIPAGLTITGVVAAYGTHTEGVEGDPNAPMVFSLGNIGPNEQEPWYAEITCDIAPDYVGYLTNDVTMASDVLDPDKSGNRATVVSVISASADLVINKDEDPDPVNAGDPLDWALVITNNGPSMATQVGVVDFLPAEVEFVSGEVFAGSANVTFSQAYNNLVVAEIGDLMPGDQVGIILHTKVKSDTAEGYVVNSAGVWSDPLEGQGTPDPDESNNIASSSSQVQKAVDLSITKTDDPDPVIAGSDLYYTITVANGGPSDASNIVVSESFDDDVTYLNWTGSNDFVKTGLTEWTLAYLAAGESKSFMAHVKVNANTVSLAGDVTTISNGVSVVSDETELDEANNAYVEDTFVNESADLKVVKIGKPDDTVRAGEELTYTVFVYNLGQSDARDVVVTDDLLSDGLFSTPVIEEGNFSCAVDQVTNEISCELPVLPAGQREAFTITVTANDEADINNWTCVESVTPDPDTDNNCAMVMTSVLPVSDLAVTKAVVGEGPWFAGDMVQFSIEVTNNGPSAAENVVIEDYVSANVTVVDIEPDVAFTAGVPGDPNAPMVIPVGTMASGDSLSYLLTMRIDADYPFDQSLDGEFLTNDVKVSSDVLDANTSNNRASAAIFVEFSSTIEVAKTVNVSEAMAGEPVEYAIYVENHGPSTAYGAVLFDPFDDQYLTFMNYEFGMGGGGECFYDATFSEVHCTLGDLAVNDGREIFLTFLVSPDTPDGYVLENLASVGADSPVSENGDTVELPVVNNADLAITKEADKLEVNAGQQLRYTISVVNNGPTTAREVIVTDVLPEGVTYVNDDLGACGWNPDSALECSLGDIAVGGSVSFTILVTVNAETTGTLVNTASVSSATTDLNEANNSATVTTPVNGFADLRVIKFGKPEGSVRAGDILTYTILVDNLGTGVAHDVRLHDEMVADDGAEFELLSVESSLPVAEDLSSLPGEFVTTGGFDLTLAELPITIGQAPWTITAQVVGVGDNDEGVTINNCATVSSPDADPNLDNNRACAEHEITNVADLTVSKTAEGQVQVMGEEGGTVELHSNAVTAGRYLFYTINVANLGTSPAENVVVEDRLPVGITFIETDTAADLSQLPDKLIWNLGLLAAGDQIEINVVALVPSYTPDGTVLDNTATVMSSMFDDDNANNTSSNRTYVGAAADIIVDKTSTPETAMFGNEIEYTVRVKNLGPSDAGLVRITDLIPDEIDAETWKYTTDGGMTFTEGYLDVDIWVNMPVDELVELTIIGVVNTYWPFQNAACASPVSVDDPMGEDNCSLVTNEQFLSFEPIELRGRENTTHRPDLTIEKIVATENYIEVTIKNVGDRRLIEPFWVDLYVDPNPAPEGVDDIWEDLTDVGWAWRITGANGLPLEVGETLVLVVDANDASFFPLARGRTVYAQADSWCDGSTAWGMVLEQSEILGLPYNNIRWSKVGARVEGYDGETARDEGAVVRGAAVSAAADDGLPARP